MTVDLVLEALDNAVVAQNPAPGLIVHTDLGSQYTSEAFGDRLQKYEMVPSFSRKGCPYDNCMHRIISRNTQKRRSIPNALQPL